MADSSSDDTSLDSHMMASDDDESAATTGDGPDDEMSPEALNSAVDVVDPEDEPDTLTDDPETGEEPPADAPVDED